jgi:hypothetical protein
VAEFDESSESFSWSYLVTEYPEVEVTENTAIYLLGYIEADEEGKTSRIIQFHHAVPQLWVLGECESTESVSE